MVPARRAQQCPSAGCAGWAMVSTPQEVDDGAPFWRCGEGHAGSRFPTQIVAPTDRQEQAVGYALETRVSYAHRDSKRSIRSYWGAVTSTFVTIAVSIASFLRPRHP